MALLAVVSLSAFVAVGIATQNNLLTSVDTALESAVEGTHIEQDNLPRIGNEEDNGVSNLPTYSVFVAWDGNIYIDSNLNVQMDSTILSIAVQTALSQCTARTDICTGRIDDYNLYYMVKSVDGGYRLAFADSTNYDKSVQHMYAAFAVGWVALMLVLLGITLYLSHYVARPVEAAWKNQQRFIADASHELKTPLTVILADTSILQQSPNKTVQEQQNWIEDITSEAERMRRLTEEMLTLARADAGEDVSVAVSNVNLSQLAERACLQFEAAAFERGLFINEQIENDLHVTGSQDRLDNALKTLLENACKYGAGTGQPVSFTLKRDGKHAVLKVTNGGSIAPDDLPHVFDRFYKSDKSRVQEGESMSFGLGLSIAKSTVEQHNGSITVTSGNGLTTFTVTLPLAKQ